jgi:hypothetical protein
VCKEKINAYETVNDELKKEVYENDSDLNRINELIKTKKSINNTF